MKIKLHNKQSTISLAPLSNKDLTLGLKGEYLWRENICGVRIFYRSSPVIFHLSPLTTLLRSSSRAQGAHVIHFDIVGFYQLLILTSLEKN